jgi:hypothetical protein
MDVSQLQMNENASFPDVFPVRQITDATGSILTLGKHRHQVDGYCVNASMLHMLHPSTVADFVNHPW